jgi:hypothetical protein
MEQKNQWLEQFLHLIAINQNDWSTILPLATLTYNNTQNMTTGLSLEIGIGNPGVEKGYPYPEIPLHLSQIWVFAGLGSQVLMLPSVL